MWIPQPGLTVSASKADRPRFWLVFLLDNLPEGSIFKVGALHITVIPWFVADLSSQEIIETFYTKFSTFQQLEIKVGKLIELGPRNVPVSLIEPSPELLAIHQEALAWFKDIEARWALKDPYVDDQFLPHIRRRGGASLLEGETIKFKSLSLVSARRQEDGLRKVAARVGSGG
ncbi:MAG: hypothetical protein JWO96_78 [Candidatus Saccharibacteria bacterium]|nr:hypothetical protein [Candidatus Saccharibacteria bacterium]